MKSYDAEQRLAINACNGKFLVLASPGCGKTDILAERIAQAHRRGIDFADMLCLTFTNRASKGMQERIAQSLNEPIEQLFVGNIHRFCSTFLFNNELIPKTTCIIDSDDVTDILMTFDADFFTNKQGLPQKDRIQQVENLETLISQKNLHHPDSVIDSSLELEELYQIILQANFDPDRISVFYKSAIYALRYQQYKQQYHLIAFSDILVLAFDALFSDTQHLYKRYPWIQVDEVQDLTPLQTAIIDQLIDTSSTYTVMYLGDEQQAIFSFLGAKVSQLEQLKDRCHGNILHLNRNYRSPKYLLDLFNAYAQHELNVSPDLLPLPTIDSPRQPFDLILTSNPTDQDECQRSVAMAQYYLSLSPSERLAILVPTNAAADRISNALNLNGIQHFKISGSDMFKSKDFKTLSSFFCLLSDDFNAMAWARLLFGINAIPTASKSRNFVAVMRKLLMTPSDLLRPQPYLAHFYHTFSQQEMVFFDTETTGLDTLHDDIVQIAAFKVSHGKRVPGSDFNLILQTSREIPSFLGSIPNPLVALYAQSSPSPRKEGLQQFLDYIGDCPLLGHNVNFDYQILKSNIQHSLKKDISFEIFDSLHIIRLVEPNLRQYKLASLIQLLHLEGKNSHLADEDISATLSLIDYCIPKIKDILLPQQEFLNHPKVQEVTSSLAQLLPQFQLLQPLLLQPAVDHPLPNIILSVYSQWRQQHILQDLGPKFDLFIHYIRQEWDPTPHPTLLDHIHNHANDLMASLNEGDLINSSNLMSEQVYIMTVYKSKGLEFDNVVILSVNDRTYPFFAVSDILNNPSAFSSDIVSKALLERTEDARKLYVALTRAKKRICISFNRQNFYGTTCQPSPFLHSIRPFFNTQN